MAFHHGRRCRITPLPETESLQESKKMNINELGARIDRPTIRELIAYATCRNRPISNSTLLRMEKDGRIPCRLKTPLTSSVWDTREVLEALGLQQ
ncbi:hypothetical protein NMBES14902_0870 [Neisseria meningitidis ES14902]|nr:hypothetical protein NMBES14902_0870 [Neisseria meningitidis ES14902]